MPMSRSSVLLQRGWLSRQPDDFQTAVLALGRIRTYARGETIYALGSEPGGTFAVLTAPIAVLIAPDASGPFLAHLARPGDWFGEGAFLTGEPRRVGLEALTDCSLFHLPLDAMERLAASDPAATRRFAQIAMMNIDLSLSVIGELMIPDVSRRLAAFLLRATASGLTPLPLTQAQVARMANTSRKVVNSVLSRFAAEGWVETGYAAVMVKDPEALHRYAAAD